MKIPILMYHRVGENKFEKQFTVSTRTFERQMQVLRDHSYSVVALSDVAAALEGKNSLPTKTVAITFDDGFADTFENAVPILIAMGFTATFFVVSRLVGLTNMWMEREGYPSARLMNWAAARELLRRGFALGSHTRTHRALCYLDNAGIIDEVEGSKLDLENQLGTPIHYFAYPYGYLDDRARGVVESCGYAAACSTRSGFNTALTDRYQLRRLDIRGSNSLRTFIRNLKFGENSMTPRKTVQYYFRRIVSKVVQ
jgi:peptidoglycan/xylan/chitin deacetylase (PgdA/CDA1 family)